MSLNFAVQFCSQPVSFNEIDINLINLLKQTEFNAGKTKEKTTNSIQN